MKLKLSILVVLVVIGISWLNHKFLSAPSSLDWIVFLMGFATIMYIFFVDKMNEVEEVKERDKTPGVSEALTDYLAGREGSSQDLIPEEVEIDGVKYTTGKPTLIVQPMLVVSDTEFNEKTNNNMDKITPKPDSKTLSAPKKEVGVSSYSVNGVPTKYRRMFDDFHSFAITHGPKSEVALIQKLAPFGYQYKIERSGSMVAFNLGFIRMPLNGFFATV